MNAARNRSSRADFDLESGGRPVAAVAQQVLAAGLQPAEQVERRDRAARSRARPAVGVEGDHHRRAVVALGDPRRDDPDHAWMPVRSGEHVGRQVTLLGDLGLGLEADPRLDVAPLGVVAVQLRRDRLRAVRVVGEQQLERDVRAVQPSRGVDPRRETKRQVVLVDLERRDPRHGHQRPQPGVRGGRRAPAVRPGRGGGSRLAVGRRRPPSPARPARGRARGRCPRPAADDAAPRRAWPRRLSRRGRGRDIRTRPDGRSARRAALPSARGRWWSVTTTSTPAARGRGDLVDGGDRAVDRDQEPRPSSGESADRLERQAVAVAAPIRQEPVDVRAELAQAADEHGRRADPVAVVVAVDGDRRARTARGRGSDRRRARCRRTRSADERRRRRGTRSPRPDRRAPGGRGSRRRSG